MLEIIVNKNDNNSKTVLLVENGILVEKYYEIVDNERLEGNIYARQS